MELVNRIAIRLRAELVRIDRRIEGAEVVAESLVWVAAWMLVPMHLARLDVGPDVFIMYAGGAGFLTSIGVLATSRESFCGGASFLRYVLRCWLAISIAGGAVFLLASWYASGAHM